MYKTLNWFNFEHNGWVVFSFHVFACFKAECFYILKCFEVYGGFLGEFTLCVSLSGVWHAFMNNNFPLYVCCQLILYEKCHYYICSLVLHFLDGIVKGGSDLLITHHWKVITFYSETSHLKIRNAYIMQTKNDLCVCAHTHSARHDSWHPL